MKPQLIVLIADDDADDRDILRDAFVHCLNGCNYVFLENGEKVTEHLNAHAENLPSLIMLDLNMPGKDGRETLKEIKTDLRFQHVPVVVFTTSSSQRDKQTAYSFGANCFITKPDTFNKLTDLVAAISKLWLS